MSCQVRGSCCHRKGFEVSLKRNGVSKNTCNIKVRRLFVRYEIDGNKTIFQTVKCHCCSGMSTSYMLRQSELVTNETNAKFFVS